jgi:hypothetical protein
MQWRLMMLVFVVQVGLVLPVSAGIFFKKKPPPAPQSPPSPAELIAVLKSDPDDGKRQAAAEQLRHLDASASPEIVPALVDALQRDTCAAVRSEAAQSLGKLRPMSQEIGMVLRLAAGHDPSMKVRWHARTALLQYQMGGFRSPKEEGPQLPTTNQEPPLAVPDNPPPAAGKTTPGSASPWHSATAPRAGTTSTPVSRTPSMGRPLPGNAPRPLLVPTEAPPLAPAPSTGEQGPMLTPP